MTVGIRETDTGGRQRIQVRCPDLPAVATEVVGAERVGNDQYDVRGRVHVARIAVELRRQPFRTAVGSVAPVNAKDDLHLLSGD